MLFLYVFPEEIILWIHLPLLEADNETAGLLSNFLPFENSRKNSGRQSEHRHHKFILPSLNASYQYSW